VQSMPAVQVTGAGANTPPVQVSGLVEQRRQRWEYETLLVRPGQDIARELNRAGGDNWEVTGSQTQNDTGMLFVLKRPR